MTVGDPTYRQAKGSELTWSEVDNNFESVYKRPPPNSDMPLATNPEAPSRAIINAWQEPFNVRPESSADQNVVGLNAALGFKWENDPVNDPQKMFGNIVQLARGDHNINDTILMPRSVHLRGVGNADGWGGTKLQMQQHPLSTPYNGLETDQFTFNDGQWDHNTQISNLKIGTTWNQLGAGTACFGVANAGEGFDLTYVYAAGSDVMDYGFNISSGGGAPHATMSMYRCSVFKTAVAGVKLTGNTGYILIDGLSGDHQGIFIWDADGGTKLFCTGLRPEGRNEPLILLSGEQLAPKVFRSSFVNSYQSNEQDALIVCTDSRVPPIIWQGKFYKYNHLIKVYDGVIDANSDPSLGYGNLLWDIKHSNNDSVEGEIYINPWAATSTPSQRLNIDRGACTRMVGKWPSTIWCSEGDRLNDGIREASYTGDPEGEVMGTLGSICWTPLGMYMMTVDGGEVNTTGWVLKTPSTP